MATIDALPIQFATVANLVTKLGPVSDEQLRAFLENPGRVHELVHLITAPAPVVPHRLDAEACRRMIDEMFPAKYDEDDGRTRATVSYPLYSDERKLLSEPTQVRCLLGLLSQLQLDVVVRRGGLSGQPPIGATELGGHLKLSTSQINRVRGVAKRLMYDEAMRVVRRLRGYDC